VWKFDKSTDFNDLQPPNILLILVTWDVSKSFPKVILNYQNNQTMNPY
jgi:hypothetical protein